MVLLLNLWIEWMQFQFMQLNSSIKRHKTSLYSFATILWYMIRANWCIFITHNFFNIYNMACEKTKCISCYDCYKFNSIKKFLILFGTQFWSQWPFFIRSLCSAKIMRISFFGIEFIVLPLATHSHNS